MSKQTKSANDTLSEEAIEAIFAPEKYKETIAENISRDLSLGVRPLPLPPPDNLDQTENEVLFCDYCSTPESSNLQLSECGKCHLAKYCSRDCQVAHWKEAHKAICKHLSTEKKAEAKRIVAELEYKPGEDTCSVIASLEELGNDDAIFYMAESRYGLFPAVETLFNMEAAGYMETVDEHLRGVISWTQFLTTSLFKGDRANAERFYCMCPYRSKDYIISSPTAWDSWMDAALYLARALKRDEFASARSRRDFGVQQKLALVHRSARDVLVSLNLALIHKSVAKALFFGSKQGAFRRTAEEADEYAITSICAKLRAMLENGGNGFADDDIDRNQTIQANVFQFTAMLAHWYRELNVNPQDGERFRKELKLDRHQDYMYDTLAVPLAEGSVELGRTLTPEELKVRTQAATKKTSATSNNPKKARGKKKNRNRRR